MPVTEQILENPTLMIIAGAAFGVAWLSLAALLSWFISSPAPKSKKNPLLTQRPSPPRPEPTHPYSEISRLPGVTGGRIPIPRQPWAQAATATRPLADRSRYFHDLLRQRVEWLEGTLAAQNDGLLSPALKEKIGQLLKEIDTLRQSSATTADWEASYEQMSRRVDELADLARPARPAVAPSEERIASIQMRREREQFLSHQSHAVGEARQMLSGSRNALEDVAAQLTDEAARREEAVRSQNQFALEHETLQKRMHELTEQRKAENKPYLDKLQDVTAAHENILREWTSEQEAAKEERARLDRRLARRQERYEKWRAAWQVQIRHANQALMEDQSVWDRKVLDAQKQLSEERERAQELMAHVEEERKNLAAETARFQEMVLAPREQQIKEIESQTAAIDGEMGAARSNFELLRLERVQQKARYEESVRLTRGAVREQQDRWKVQARAAREESAKHILQSEQELNLVNQAAQAEAQDLGRKKEIFLASLSAEKVTIEAQKEVWQKNLEQEKNQKQTALEQSRQALADLRRQEAEERIHLQTEIMNYQRRRDDLKNWAHARHESMDKLLTEIQNNSRERLMKLELEKNRVKNAMTSDRQTLHQFFIDTQTAWERQQQDLAKYQKAAELEHRQFVENAMKEEDALKKGIFHVDAQLENLRKKLENLSTKGEWRLNHEKERYERVILTLKQKCEQANANSEAALSTQKLQLDSLMRRMASRQSRVERIKQKRQEQMTQLLAEAQQAVEAARRALWSEGRQVVERLNALREEKQHREEKKEQLLQSPERLWQEVQQKSQEEAQQFHEEKKRLELEAETRLRECREKMAANENALADSETLLKQMDGDLARQEALMQQFSTAVRHQIQQLNSLREDFNALSKIGAPTKFSTPSVA